MLDFDALFLESTHLLDLPELPVIMTRAIRKNPAYHLSDAYSLPDTIGPVVTKRPIFAIPSTNTGAVLGISRVRSREPSKLRNINGSSSPPGVGA